MPMAQRWQLKFLTGLEEMSPMHKSTWLCKDLSAKGSWQPFQTSKNQSPLNAQEGVRESSMN